MQLKDNLLRQAVEDHYPKFLRPKFLPTRDPRTWIFIADLWLMGIEAKVITNEGESLDFTAVLNSTGSKPMNLLTVTEVTITAAHPAEILARSEGEVRRHEIFDDQFEPVTEGLYCPKIFGLTPTMDRFGHIALARPATHPLFPNIPDLTLEILPVSPTGFRYYHPSGMPRSYDNLLYQAVVARNNHLRELITAAADQNQIEDAHQQLQSAVDQLFLHKEEGDTTGLLSQIHHIIDWLDPINK
jgi:DNA-directed RNA polymerase beta' subunit